MSSPIPSTIQSSVSLTKLSSIAKQSAINMTVATGITLQNMTLQSVLNSPVTLAVSSSKQASIENSPVTTYVNTFLPIPALTPNVTANALIPTDQTSSTHKYSASEPNATTATVPSVTQAAPTNSALATAEPKLPTTLLPAFSYAATAKPHSQTMSRLLTSMQFNSDILPSLTRSVSRFPSVDRAGSSRAATIEESGVVLSSITAGSETESSQPITETARQSSEITLSSTEAVQPSTENLGSKSSSDTSSTLPSHTLSSFAQLKTVQQQRKVPQPTAATLKNKQQSSLKRNHTTIRPKSITSLPCTMQSLFTTSSTFAYQSSMSHTTHIGKRHGQMKHQTQWNKKSRIKANPSEETKHSKAISMKGIDL